MANIFKEIRKKHRRKKLLAQRAKLEQSQGGAAGAPEDYQTRLLKHRHATMKRTLIIVCVIAAVAAAVILFIEKRSYRNYTVLQTSEQEDIVSTGYVEMDGRILRYSPDGVSLVKQRHGTLLELSV